MERYYLTEITTKDGLIHQGIYYEPKRKGRAAILYVHGLTSAFYHGLSMYKALLPQCEKYGLGFAAFNNRGHDVVTGIKKVDPKAEKGYTRVNGGAGYERFEDCTHDIDAGISFLIDKGYQSVILFGHSTGANKVCYYAGKIPNDHRVSAIILGSPVSDRLDPSVNQKDLRKKLKLAKKMIAHGDGEELTVGLHAFPSTFNRFVSSFESNSDEDVFDYGDKEPEMKVYSKITKPLLVLLGSNDEYLDRPASDVKKVFDGKTRSSMYKFVVLQEALHGYQGVEKDVAEIIINFIQKNVSELRSEMAK